MEKKRKWEREYEKYSNLTELDERIEYLGDLINGKVATKEEYDEHKKLMAIKTNLPKVKNILELRGKLEEQIKEMKAEMAKRELRAKYDKAITVLEDEMKKLEEEKTRLEKEIKDPNLTPEKKAELKTKLTENEKKRQENNVKFGKCHEGKQKENKDAEQSKFKDVKTEDLKNEIIKLSSNISKCNLACNKLMQGFSWKSVELALDKYENEKLTAKGKQAAKMKQNREAAKAANAKEQQSVKAEPTKAEPTKVEPEKQQENSIANITRWQKIKNGARGVWKKIEDFFFEEVDEEPEKTGDNTSEPKTTVWQKIKNWFKKEEQPEQQPVQQPAQQPTQQPAQQSKQDDFREYLKKVAEIGIDGIEQEKLAEKQARILAAKERLEANRAEALKREAERNAKKGGDER